MQFFTVSWQRNTSSERCLFMNTFTKCNEVIVTQCRTKTYFPIMILFRKPNKKNKNNRKPQPPLEAEYVRGIKMSFNYIFQTDNVMLCIYMLMKSQAVLQDVLLIYIFVMWFLNLKRHGLEFCFSFKGLL